MKRLVVVLGVVGLIAGSLAARDEQVVRDSAVARLQKRTFGAGATLCSVSLGTDKVVDNADGSRSVTSGPKDPVQVSWILGYLSAAGVTGKAAELNGQDYALGWISSRCGPEPTRTIAEVAAEFVASQR